MGTLLAAGDDDDGRPLDATGAGLYLAPDLDADVTARSVGTQERSGSYRRSGAAAPSEPQLAFTTGHSYPRPFSSRDVMGGDGRGATSGADPGVAGKEHVRCENRHAFTFVLPTR